MAVTFQVKCGPLLGAVLAANTIITTISLDTHMLVTEQQPVSHLTQQANDKDTSPSGVVMSQRTVLLWPFLKKIQINI